MSFNWNYRRLLAIEIHLSGLTIQITNLQGDLIGTPDIITIPQWTQDSIYETLFKAISATLRQPGAPWAGIGIVIPGHVSRDGITVVNCAGISDWRKEALGTELSAVFGLPVILDNPANALVQTLWAKRLHGIDEIMAVNLRHEGHLCMGLIIEGKLVYGSCNLVGNIGHIAVNHNVRVCKCGRTGCLETLFRAMRVDMNLRPMAIRGLAEVCAGLVTALNPDQLMIQVDEFWGSNDTELFRIVMQERCAPNVIERLDMLFHVNNPVEIMTGITHRLAAQLLDVRDGKIMDWVCDEAIESDEVVPVG